MAKYTGAVPGESGQGGFDTEQGGGFSGVFNKVKKASRNDRQNSRSRQFRGGNDKEYFENLAKLEREKSQLRDWEHSNRTQRDWQTMAERATIGDQELTRQTSVHVPNLIQAVGDRSGSVGTTAGNRTSVGAARPRKPEPGPMPGPTPGPTPGPSSPRDEDIEDAEIVEDTPKRPEPKAIEAPKDRGSGRGVHIAGPTIPNFPGYRPPVMTKDPKTGAPVKNPEYTAWEGRRGVFEEGIKAETGVSPDAKKDFGNYYPPDQQLK